MHEHTGEAQQPARDRRAAGNQAIPWHLLQQCRMPRLPTYHEATIRGPVFESSRKANSPGTSMPKVLMLIMVGIAIGAALTVATMAMTDTPASTAEGRVAKGGNTDQGFTMATAQVGKRPVVTRSTLQVRHGLLHVAVHTQGAVES